MTSINNSVNNPVPSDTDVIKSFAKNAEVRQNNFSMVDFATTCILDGSSVVSKSTGVPVDYKEIVNTFNQLCTNTNRVEIAIGNGHKLTPSLLSAHRDLQSGLNSISDRVLQAALKTGVIQPVKVEQSASRLPSAGKVVVGTLGTAAAIAGYTYREVIKDNMPEVPAFIKDNMPNMPEFAVPAFIKDNMPNMPEVPAFIKDNMPNMPEFAVPAFIKDNMPNMPEFAVPAFIKDNMPNMPALTMPSIPSLDTIREVFFSIDSSATLGITMNYAQMGATAGAVAVGAGIIYTGVKYRKEIGNGIATVANTVANVAVAPFKMCASVFHRA